MYNNFIVYLLLVLFFFQLFLLEQIERQNQYFESIIFITLQFY